LKIITKQRVKIRDKNNWEGKNNKQVKKVGGKISRRNQSFAKYLR